VSVQWIENLSWSWQTICQDRWEDIQSAVSQMSSFTTRKEKSQKNCLDSALSQKTQEGNSGTKQQ